MLASKIWEDATVLNADFAHEVSCFPLYSLMKLESAFLGICKFDMFIREHTYEKYFLAISKHSKPVMSPRRSSSGTGNFAI